MKIKMYEVLALQDFCVSIKDNKMPLKTVYKLSRLIRKIEEEAQFYSTELTKIIQKYGKKENGQLVYSKDMTAVEIIPGQESNCNTEVEELRNLEVDIGEFSFSIEEFENLNLTLLEMSGILPLIVE